MLSLLIACLAVSFSGSAYSSFELVEVEASGNNYKEKSGGWHAAFSGSPLTVTIPANNKGLKVAVKAKWNGGSHLWFYKDGDNWYDYEVNQDNTGEISLGSGYYSDQSKCFLINNDNSYKVTLEVTGDDPNPTKISFNKVSSIPSVPSELYIEANWYSNWNKNDANLKMTKSADGKVFTWTVNNYSANQDFQFRFHTGLSSGFNANLGIVYYPNSENESLTINGNAVTIANSYSVSGDPMKNWKVNSNSSANLVITVDFSGTNPTVKVTQGSVSSDLTLRLAGSNISNPDAWTKDGEWYTWTGNIPQGAGYGVATMNGSTQSGTYATSNAYNDPADGASYVLASGSWNFSKAQNNVTIKVKPNNGSLMGASVQLSGFKYTETPVASQYDYYLWTNIVTGDNNTWTAKKFENGKVSYDLKDKSGDKQFGLKRLDKDDTNINDNNPWYAGSKDSYDITESGNYAIVAKSSGVTPHNFQFSATDYDKIEIELVTNSTTDLPDHFVITLTKDNNDKTLYIGGNEFGGVNSTDANTALTYSKTNTDGTYEYKPIKVNWHEGTMHEFKFYKSASKASASMGAKAATTIGFSENKTDAGSTNAYIFKPAIVNLPTWIQVTSYNPTTNEVKFKVLGHNPAEKSYVYLLHSNIFDSNWSDNKFIEENGYNFTLDVKDKSGSKKFGLIRYQVDNNNDYYDHHYYKAGSNDDKNISGACEVSLGYQDEFEIDVTNYDYVNFTLVINDDNTPKALKITPLETVPENFDYSELALFISGVENHHNKTEGAVKMENKGNGLYEYAMGDYNGAPFWFCVYDSQNRAYHKTENDQDEVALNTRVDGIGCVHAITDTNPYGSHPDWHVANSGRKLLKNAKIEVNIKERWVKFSGDDNGTKPKFYFIGDLNNWFSDEFEGGSAGQTGYRRLDKNNGLHKWAFTETSANVYEFTVPDNKLTGQFQIYGGDDWSADYRYVHPGNGEDHGKFVSTYWNKPIVNGEEFEVAHKNGLDGKTHNLHLAHNAYVGTDSDPVKITLDLTDSNHPKVTVHGEPRDYYMFYMGEKVEGENNDDTDRTDALRAYMMSAKPNSNNYYLPALESQKLRDIKDKTGYGDLEDLVGGHIADGAGVEMTRLSTLTTAAAVNEFFDGLPVNQRTALWENGTLPNGQHYDSNSGELWVVKMPRGFEAAPGTKFRVGLLNSEDKDFSANGQPKVYWALNGDHIVILPINTHVHLDKTALATQLRVNESELHVYYRLYGPSSDYTKTNIYGHNGTDGKNGHHNPESVMQISGDQRNPFNAASAEFNDFGWVELGEKIEIPATMHDKGGTWHAALLPSADGVNAADKYNHRVEIYPHLQNSFVQFKVVVDKKIDLDNLNMNKKNASRYESMRRTEEKEETVIYTPLWMTMGEMANNVANEKPLNGESMYETLDADDIATGIEQITDYFFGDDNDTDTPVYYYNLQGIRVNNPANGIFIRVKGDRSVKIAL